MKNNNVSEEPVPGPQPPLPKPDGQPENEPGNAGETHQIAGDNQSAMTTNMGVAISDDQTSLKAGPLGPALLEDFILREKITHFDHERVPERIVHARGSGAHGFFELTESLEQYTTASILTEVGERTPVFVRISTVAGGAGSVDTPRDVRGFAIKFYTKQGNWDIVGNNVPVFFIHDAIKFPDVIHAVKMEPDRGYPQAGSAHDTFWDFISLTPESTHMIMWIMSDRTIPRSLRMIEGFGIHTFRLINAEGKSTFVKFHWRPKLGMQSTIWDETVKISGADNDYHRRDLFEAINKGDYPEWEFAVQLFTEEEAAKFPFDVLDPTKLIPEELVPLKVIGRFVLNRWPDNFFAETEQSAFCPANIVPGIDFSNDPLLQGRLFSYQDTQLLRFGTPNFHQLPINAPKLPIVNYQRDGHMQRELHKGRVSYEPNTLDPSGPRESPALGFQTFRSRENGDKTRLRPASFADHYSQARQFYLSQTESEQAHLISALVFELSKLEHPHIREAVVSRLLRIDESMAKRVAAGLRLDALPEPAPLTVPVMNLPESPKLSIHKNMKQTLEGRSVGILVADGTDAALVVEVKAAIEKELATAKVIAPNIGGYIGKDGKKHPADGQLAGTPSCLFDAVVLVLSEKGAKQLVKESAAIGFVSDAFVHLKAVGFTPEAQVLLDKGNVTEDPGVVPVANLSTFIKAAKTRQWKREPKVRILP